MRFTQIEKTLQQLTITRPPIGAKNHAHIVGIN